MKLSVLIVDDNESDRYLLKRELADAGVTGRVFESTDGVEALGFLRDYDANFQKCPGEFPPIVIFLDINMPRLDGFGFLKEFAELRVSNASFTSCVLVMFTSSASPEDRARVTHYDFVEDFVVKGKDTPEELRAKLERAVPSAVRGDT